MINLVGSFLLFGLYCIFTMNLWIYLNDPKTWYEINGRI